MEGIPVGVYGKYCKTVIALARKLRIAQCKTPSKEQFTEPAVYICRHSDAKGPIYTMLNIPMEIHPWSFYVFCETETCRKHYAEYTFPVRFGWSKWKSQFVSWLGAGAFTGLLKSAGAIPVYRNAMKIYTTFKLSVEALKKGESILIFPDIEYTKTEGDTGALYDGFVILERMYLKETGKHLPFVPLHLSFEKNSMFVGEPIMFEDGIPFKTQQPVVVQKLHDAMNDMIDKYGV